MIKRDILNHLGQKIGEMDFDDNTSESVISAKLAVYAVAPVVPTLNDIVKTKIKGYQKLSPALMDEIMASNTLDGITAAESAQVFTEYAPIILAVLRGAFPTALYMLQQKTPSGFMTQERIDSLIAMIKNYL